jgi:hypothetical protein
MTGKRRAWLTANLLPDGLVVEPIIEEFVS